MSKSKKFEYPENAAIAVDTRLYAVLRIDDKMEVGNFNVSVNFNVFSYASTSKINNLASRVARDLLIAPFER